MTSQNVEHFQAILDAAARGDFHAEHDFLTVIVESFIEIEATAPLRLANGPAGEAARHFGNILLRVAAIDAEGMQFHQLARVIFIETASRFWFLTAHIRHAAGEIGIDGLEII